MEGAFDNPSHTTVIQSLEMLLDVVLRPRLAETNVDSCSIQLGATTEA